MELLDQVLLQLLLLESETVVVNLLDVLIELLRGLILIRYLAEVHFGFGIFLLFQLSISHLLSLILEKLLQLGSKLLSWHLALAPDALLYLLLWQMAQFSPVGLDIGFEIR